MSKYTYTDPLENGRHKRFYLTKKQHNEFFPNRKMKWYHKYEYYYNDSHIILHRFINWKGIACNTLLAPFLMLFYGLANIKEYKREFKEMYNQKQTGSFSSDHVRKSSELYDDIISIIKESEK